MMKANPKNIFEWLNELTFIKSPTNKFKEEAWDNFNAYMVHRFVSMYQDYVEIANIAQRFHPTDKKGIYNFYCEMLPKKKMFLRYIKSKIKKRSKEILEPIAKYYECSFEEANDYIILSPKVKIETILKHIGTNDKDVKKLMKLI
jgi:hypothetical protein